MSAIAFFNRHRRILGALMMRELTTRFGREGLGFMWLVGEPLIFCFGVMALWTLTKPEYEHGIRVAPFVMTGYMSLLLIRHHINMSVGALQANIGLLYHRQIKSLHIFLARNGLEFLGTTTAFVVVYVALLAVGEVQLPSDWLLLYAGWALLGWMSMGLGLIMSGLAMRYDLADRLVSVISYAMIPISGAFFMVAWLPAGIRDAYMLIPFPHAIEMVRASVFGEFVETHYDPVYALAVGTVMNLLGLLLVTGAEDKIDVD